MYDDYPRQLKIRKDLIRAVEAIPPLCELLSQAYEQGMGCPYTDPQEKEDNWPEPDPWDEDFFTDRYPRLSTLDLKKLNQMFQAWLNEEPHWSSEETCFHLPSDSQALAFGVFESYGAE